MMMGLLRVCDTAVYSPTDGSSRMAARPITTAATVLIGGDKSWREMESHCTIADEHLVCVVRATTYYSRPAPGGIASLPGLVVCRDLSSACSSPNSNSGMSCQTRLSRFASSAYAAFLEWSVCSP